MKKFTCALLSTALFFTLACDNVKEKDEPGDMPKETPTDNSNTTIEVQKNDTGSDVSIDVNKKGGSVQVDDKGNSIDITIGDKKDKE